MGELQNTLSTLREERRQHALSANTGTVNLIRCGFDHVKEVFEIGTSENSLLPGEEVEYCFIKLLQRARGSFDLKQTGTEMTNGNGINMLASRKQKN